VRKPDLIDVLALILISVGIAICGGEHGIGKASSHGKEE
jgi:hypothetical protein